MADPGSQAGHRLGMVVARPWRIDWRQRRGSVDHLRLGMAGTQTLVDERAVLCILHLRASARTDIALVARF